MLRLPKPISAVRSILKAVLICSSIYGLVFFIIPIFTAKSDKKDEGLVIEDIRDYDAMLQCGEKKCEPILPVLQIVLIGSVLLPLVIVTLIMLTVCLVICVYLKENFKNLKRVLNRESTGLSRFTDKEVANEELRREFANNAGGHIELHEEADGEDSDQRDNLKSKRQVLDFYLELMPQ